MKKILAFFTVQEPPGTRTFSHMLKDSRGTIAIIAGFVFTLLILAAGSAVDGMRYFIMRTELRALADSAAVSAGANPANNTEALLRSVAAEYIRANQSPRTVGNITIASAYDAENEKFTLTLTSRLDTTLMGVWGMPFMQARATAEVLRALPGPIELALALDVTTSMGFPVSGRPVCSATGNVMEKQIDVLQCGLINLINDLASAVTETTKDKIKVGAVPFRDRVNVGRHYTDVDWLQPLLGQEWSGCVGYRGVNFRDTIADPTGNKYPRVPQAFGCPPDSNSLVPLREIYTRENRQTLLATAANVVPGGFSMLPSGIVWAWHLLSSDGPNPIFTEARSKAEMERVKGRKVLLLFTDGNNTVGPALRFFSGFSLSQGADDIARADDVQARLCRNIKDNDIEIFVISFVTIDVIDEGPLMSCSGAKVRRTDRYYFRATTPQQVVQAFRDVTLSFRPVRLTN